MKVRREELAWVAGFFDGEGSAGHYEYVKADGSQHGGHLKRRKHSWLCYGRGWVNTNVSNLVRLS